MRSSSRRVDASDFAGRYALAVVSLGAITLALSWLWSGERFFEDALGRRMREAHAAPWEVACFALVLMGAGATKRLFGADRRVVPTLFVAIALNVGATVVLTGLAQETVALFGFAATAGALVAVGARFSVGPWAVFAFLALAFASTAGAGFSGRLPPGSDGDWAIVSLAMGTGAVAGHLPFLRSLSLGSRSAEDQSSNGAPA